MRAQSGPWDGVKATDPCIERYRTIGGGAGMGPLQFGHLPEFAALDIPHTAIHGAVRQAVIGREARDKGAVQRAVQEVRRCSGEVVALLDRIELAGQPATLTTSRAVSVARAA